MNHSPRTAALVFAWLVTGACQRAPASTTAPAPDLVAPAPLAAAAPAAPALDGRTPLPLTARMATHQKQEMRDYLRVVQEITAALARDDFDAVEASARRIGWSELEAAMCKHMGAGAPGFAALGEHFHRTADGVAEAARKHDRAAVEVALGATLDTCVGCHETYRQEIVDDASFAKLGGGGMGAGMDCPMTKGK